MEIRLEIADLVKPEQTIGYSGSYNHRTCGDDTDPSRFLLQRMGSFLCFTFFVAELVYAAVSINQRTSYGDFLIL